MPAPYSVDLRKRVVDAYDAGGGTYDSLAATFKVGIATVNRWLRRRREHGDVAPAPHAGGQKRRIDESADALLRELVRAQPDATLEELKVLLSSRLGLTPGLSTIGRALARLDLPRKKRPSSRPSARATPLDSSGGTSSDSTSVAISNVSFSSTRQG